MFVFTFENQFGIITKAPVKPLVGFANAVYAPKGDGNGVATENIQTSTTRQNLPPQGDKSQQKRKSDSIILYQKMLSDFWHICAGIQIDAFPAQQECKIP